MCGLKTLHSFGPRDIVRRASVEGDIERLFGSALLSSAKGLFAHARMTCGQPIEERGLGMREGIASADGRTDRLPYTAGGMTRIAYARAKAAGIELAPLLRRAGLTPHQIEDPRN